MKSCIATLLVSLTLSTISFQSAHAIHDFTEDYDEAGGALAGAGHINTDVPIMGGAGHFDRHTLVDFSDEPLLPVTNEGDKELRWDNGFGAAEGLALTPDDEDGNYPLLAIKSATYFAMVGDLEAADARAGVVVRHTGPDEEGTNRKFYCAYGHVMSTDDGLKVQFHLQRWFGGTDFEHLDSGPAVSGLFDIAMTENFKIELEVSEPDEDNLNHLMAQFYRLVVLEGGVVQEELLASLSGSDRRLALGRVGLYCKAGSVNTKIAFDETSTEVISAIAVERGTWGTIKALYR